MTGKKRGMKLKSNYHISIERENIKKGDANVVGKLRSNFLGTEFGAFDNGKNPGSTQNFTEIRCEIARIAYVEILLSNLGKKSLWHERSQKNVCVCALSQS